MRRTGEMQVNVSGLRRNLKNLAHNYSDAQRKVREATSNDPWGPNSTIMAEISDLTYNVVAFTEIMAMIWKRLNDHGRYWRHVYKALVLLEYLIKTGSEKISQQCKENIFAIQTLQDFQYLDEGKDQGQNVREKAKQLVILLMDDDRLRSERARAMKAKERFAQTACAFGSDGGLDTSTSPKYPAFRGDWNTSSSSSREAGGAGGGGGAIGTASELPSDLEVARPQTAGEEELQLQLALAMSKEEAEQEEQKRRSDDVRLQLALSQSQQDFKSSTQEKSGAMLDLLDVNLDEAATASNIVDPWGMPQSPKIQNNSTGWQSNAIASPPPTLSVSNSDPWAPPPAAMPVMPPPPATKSAVSDPWNPKTMNTLVETAIRNDPWSPVSQSSSDLDDFDAITNRNRTISPAPSNDATLNTSDPFELNLLGDSLALPPGVTGPSSATGATKKTPHSFLGENSALVNLDNLVTSKPANQMNTANPFSETQTSRPVFNPQPPKPTMNQIKQAPFASSRSPVPAAAAAGAPPPAAVPLPAYTSYNQMPSMPAFATIPTSAPNVNGTFNTSANAATAVDPWTPLPAKASSANNAPWIKPGEQANPFLS